MVIKKVKFDWDDEKSISKAEKEKFRLENQGYMQIGTQRDSMSKWTLVYEK